MRLQTFLSRAGVASRRRAEALMRDGRVAVNGVVVREPGTRVAPAADRVTGDGRAVRLAPPRWVLLHKPAGVLTTRRDPRGGRTIYELLPRELRSLHYVGRLDRDSEGLLLLTNRGDVAHRLTHPSTAVEREYRVLVGGDPSPAVLARLVQGVALEDGLARAARARRLGREAQGTWLEIVLREGRKREVRRMLAAVGHPVLRLLRVRYGPVRLGALPPGAWRMLSDKEIEALRRAVRFRQAGWPPGGGENGASRS